MKIYQTMMSIDGDPGKLFKMDTIHHEGRIWLVPKWLSPPSREWQKPERIVCLSNLKHQVLPQGSPYGDYMIPYSIPTSVLYGPGLPPKDSEYVVIEDPDVHVPSGNA